jgi:DNA-binding transcriptional regulator LsrR (DeoR family)
MLPRELAEHKKILFQYLDRVSAWGRIFGNHEGGKRARNTPRPLADRLQLILGAVGSPKTPDRFLTPEVLRNVLSEQDARRLLRVVDGDVAGVFMEKPGLDKTDRKFLDGIHDGWTGVREEHLRQCTEKACAGKAVGVVLYAIHKSRARPILSAIRRGIVSHLVTEMGLAVELKRLVEQELRASR